MNTYKLILTCAICTITAISFNSCKDGASTPPAETAAVESPQIDLHTAVLTDNMPAVDQLIQSGSDLNVQDPFGGSSPLITAAVFGKTEMAKKLLDAGADINFQNNDGSTALITAAFFCRPEIVQLLLEKGADKTIKNKYNTTALDNVSAPFDQVKEVYVAMEQAMAPMGLKLDYAYLETERPIIAEMLK